MSKSKARFHVITGGPGSGKSTLIEALRAAGHPIIEEAGRAIIREQVASGGNALPWGDSAAYARLMLKRDIASWRAARDLHGRVFFDRGIPDIQGYLRLIGANPLPEIEAAVAEYGYAETVFVAPPWRAIYTGDAERKQDFAEACRTCETMCDTYSRLGHRLVELPAVPVAERLAFVLGELDK